MYAFISAMRAACLAHLIIYLMKYLVKRTNYEAHYLVSSRPPTPKILPKNMQAGIVKITS
jgi:hypothetical protein